jgi:hypothetical protein
LLRVGSGGAAAEKRSHLVSDHLVLGASLMAMFTTELGLGVTDLKRAVARQNPLEVARLACILTGGKCSSCSHPSMLIVHPPSPSADTVLGRPLLCH